MKMGRDYSRHSLRNTNNKEILFVPTLKSLWEKMLSCVLSKPKLLLKGMTFKKKEIEFGARSIIHDEDW